MASGVSIGGAGGSPDGSPGGGSGSTTTGTTTGTTGTTAGSTAGGRARASRGVVGRWIGAAALGVLVGVVGTVLHRSVPPWGMALCLALVLSSTVLVRAWAGLLPVVAYAVGWLAVVQGMSLTGPGGDVLVPAGDSLGYVWGLGGMVVVGVACFLPSRWFRDAPAAA